jgi:Ca-activated chloride channel homolog
MGTKKLHSRIYWSLLAFVILIGLWALGALYASDAPSPPADNKTQDQNQETDKNAPKKEDKAVSIKVNVNLVTTDVSILGRPTPGLNAEDFVIYDDGVAQPVSFFSQDELPIAVGLLIDASESTRPFMPVMQLSGISALRHLKLGDKAVLYSFYGQIVRHTDLTDDIVSVVDAFDRIEIRLGTRIYDAIIEASNYLKNMAPNSRRAIILISDDQNQNMGRTPPDPMGALATLLETSTTLYNVLAQSTFGPAPNEESQESVEAIPKMVVETGGEYFSVGNPGGLQSALASAMVNIRKQYTLGFNPSNPGRSGTYHRLEVKLASQKHCPGCVLRTRKAYYSGATISTASRGAISKPIRTAEETDEVLVQKAIMSVANNEDFDFKDVQFSAQSSATTDANNKPVFKIDLKIPAQNIGFRIVEGRYVAKLRIAILVSNNLRVITSELKGFNLRLSEETYKKNLETGILFSTTVPQKADKGTVKIVLYDMGTDLIGSAKIKSNN